MLQHPHSGQIWTTRLSRTSTLQAPARAEYSIFQSTRLSRTSTLIIGPTFKAILFQSTRLSRTSTRVQLRIKEEAKYFNPQGSREPRPNAVITATSGSRFQSTRLSRTSTFRSMDTHNTIPYFNPQGSREPRRLSWFKGVVTSIISIHKALANLDLSVNGYPQHNTLFQSTRLSRTSTPVLV